MATRTKDSRRLSELIQGVGEGRDASDADVLDSFTQVSSAVTIARKWVSSAISFVVPPARLDEETR